MLSLAGLPVEIVVLRCPYLNLHDRQMRDLFSKMIYLKHKGYGKNHELGSLPLDTTDYVADHPLICVRDKTGELLPISGSKVITYDTCQFFNLEFAMESCFRKNGKVRHLEQLYGIIEKARLKSKVVAYHGGYTIDPLARHHAQDRDTIRELFIGATVNYFLDNQVSELLGLGVPEFKTENFFYQWGYHRCTQDGKELDSFPLHFLPGTDGVMMHLEAYSSYVLELGKKYESLWLRRTEIGVAAQEFLKNPQVA